MEFHELLKQLRTEAGLTQKQLGERIGVTKSVISYYELQERIPSPDTLKRLLPNFMSPQIICSVLNIPKCLMCPV